MAATLHNILKRPDTWQGRDRHSGQNHMLSSGNPQLDRVLGGGWPRGALTELCCDHPGSGELSLLLPALRQLSQTGKALFLIDPPWQPYAPALADAGVDLQQLYILHSGSGARLRRNLLEILRSSCSGATLCWPQRHLQDYAVLRKLQLAASEGRGLAVLLQQSSALQCHSPAALRLALQPAHDSMQLQIHKLRGAVAGQTLSIPRPLPPQGRTWQFVPLATQQHPNNARQRVDHDIRPDTEPRLWH